MVVSYVYALIDPRDNSVKYIGKSIRPRRRLEYHMFYAPKADYHSGRWINCLLKKGLAPILLILECCSSDEEALIQEVIWIKHFKFIGAKLTNLSGGGEGGSGLVVLEESRLKISKSLKGRKRPAHVIEKVRKSLMGKSPSAEVRAKLSLSNTGQKRSLETREKMSRSRMGMKYSPETLRNMAEAQRGKIHSEETKRKMSMVRFGKKHTDFTKKKVGESQKKAWKTRCRVTSPEIKKKLSEAAKKFWDNKRSTR